MLSFRLSNSYKPGPNRFIFKYGLASSSTVIKWNVIILSIGSTADAFSKYTGGLAIVVTFAGAVVTPIPPALVLAVLTTSKWASWRWEARGDLGPLVEDAGVKAGPPPVADGGATDEMCDGSG
mmetsp:Transcript_22315/g.48808  ORF Transcript_22315/g.48808 Transcript_22315/m.48808 type:complete len:123 (-) Transcript_22315:293-661(-)